MTPLIRAPWLGCGLPPTYAATVIGSKIQAQLIINDNIPNDSDVWQETIHYRTKVLCYVPLDIAELLAIHKNRNDLVVIQIVRLSDKLK